MAKVSMVLVDRDAFFVERFGRFILEHNNFFEVVTFTQPEYLIDYLTKNTVNILLIEKELLNDKIIALKGNGLVIMLDDVSSEEGIFSSVNKYQKTDNIIKEITFKYAESIGDKSIISDNSNAAHIISVYSPIGGSGKTTVSTAMAATLSKIGYPSVYFNAEKFNSGLFGMDMGQAEGLSDIFLKLKNKNTNLSFEVAKRLMQDESGVRYFIPPQSSMEFNEMTGEEICRILKETASTSDIKYVVVDLPTEFGTGVTDILKMSDSVVFIVMNYVIGTNKVRAFLNETNIFPELSLIYEKFMPVVNKCETPGVPHTLSQFFAEKPIWASIPYINNINKYTRVSDLAGVMENYLMDIVRYFVSNESAGKE